MLRRVPQALAENAWREGDWTVLDCAVLHCRIGVPGVQNPWLGPGGMRTRARSRSRYREAVVTRAHKLRLSAPKWRLVVWHGGFAHNRNTKSKISGGITL